MEPQLTEELRLESKLSKTDQMMRQLHAKHFETKPRFSKSVSIIAAAGSYVDLLNGVDIKRGHRQRASERGSVTELPSFVDELNLESKFSKTDLIEFVEDDMTESDDDVDELFNMNLEDDTNLTPKEQLDVGRTKRYGSRFSFFAQEKENNLRQQIPIQYKQKARPPNRVSIIKTVGSYTYLLDDIDHTASSLPASAIPLFQSYTSDAELSDAEAYELHIDAEEYELEIDDEEQEQ
eukprot:98439_1